MKRPGFTVIEVLCVVSVIAVLIALVVPALSGSRARADSTLCLSNVRSISQQQHACAADLKEAWPNVKESGDVDSRIYGFDLNSTGYRFRAISQVHMRMAPLIPRYWDERSGFTQWSCRRRLIRFSGGDDDAGFTPNPAAAGVVSYHQPVGMIADPVIWHRDASALRSNAPAHVRRVYLHEFIFPSQKVSFSELFAMHGNGQPASGSPDTLNAGCVDGHARIVKPPDARMSLRYEG